MNILIYFTGLLIGIAAFLYLFYIVTAGHKKIKNLKTPEEKQSEQKMDSNGIAFRNRPALPPGTRVCPLCGSELTRFEGLYASKILDKNNAKLLIMGCRYCYKDDEDPVKPKKSMDLK